MSNGHLTHYSKTSWQCDSTKSQKYKKKTMHSTQPFLTVQNKIESMSWDRVWKQGENKHNKSVIT